MNQEVRSMNFIGRAYRFIFGFFLFLKYSEEIDLNTLLKNKRVAIVGAANSAYHSGKGSFIDNFDVVVRINKAPTVLKDGQWAIDIGRKADILFHSFFENEKSGGGPLDLNLYDSLGIKYLINPIASYSGYRVVFNFYKKYISKRATYTLPKNTYAGMQRKLGKYRPTIGFCALHSILETEFSELYITGFTFFKTAFGEGYRNEMKQAHEVQKYIRDAGLHDPDLEFEIFLDMLKANRTKNIVMDNALTEIVAAYAKR